MGFSVGVYMGYNVKGIKERRASRLSTDPSVEMATAWSSPAEGGWGWQSILAMLKVSSLRASLKGIGGVGQEHREVGTSRSHWLEGSS